MKSIGLTPTPQSGAGWLIKEDGQNDNIMAQLKSTDRNSYTFSLTDYDKLCYHSIIENKLPLFILQFLQREEIFFIVKIEDIIPLAELLKGNADYKRNYSIVNALKDTDNETVKADKTPTHKLIRSTTGGKNKLNKQIEDNKIKTALQYKEMRKKYKK